VIEAFHVWLPSLRRCRGEMHQRLQRGVMCGRDRSVSRLATFSSPLPRRNASTPLKKRERRNA
jgi:hypothetical protein